MTKFIPALFCILFIPAAFAQDLRHTTYGGNPQKYKLKVKVEPSSSDAKLWLGEYRKQLTKKLLTSKELGGKLAFSCDYKFSEDGKVIEAKLITDGASQINRNSIFDILSAESLSKPPEEIQKGKFSVSLGNTVDNASPKTVRLGWCAPLKSFISTK